MLKPLTDAGLLLVISEDKGRRGVKKIRCSKRKLDGFNPNERVKAVKILSDFALSVEDYTKTFVAAEVDAGAQAGANNGEAANDAAAA